MTAKPRNNTRPRSGLILLQVLVLGLFCLFTLRLWYLQVHKGVTFAEMARDNQLRQVLINSARGRIVDKTGTPLAVSEPSFALGLVREDCKDRGKATLAQVSANGPAWNSGRAGKKTVRRGKNLRQVKPFDRKIIITRTSPTRLLAGHRGQFRILLSGPGNRDPPEALLSDRAA